MTKRSYVVSAVIVIAAICAVAFYFLSEAGALPAQVATSSSSPLIVDNKDPGFSKTGSWFLYNYRNFGYRGDVQIALQSSAGPSTAQWLFENVPEGNYEVQATWFSHPILVGVSYKGFYENAQVFDESVNQKVKPTGELFDGAHWQTIANNVSIHGAGSEFRVTINSDSTNGRLRQFFSADAIRLVKKGPTPGSCITHSDCGEMGCTVGRGSDGQCALKCMVPICSSGVCGSAIQMAACPQECGGVNPSSAGPSSAGPSSSGPSSNARLAISVSTLNTTDTAVSNSEDINLLRFEARAGEAEDVLLTKLIFEAALGSLVNDLQDFALWVDTDGDRVVDTVLESGVAARANNDQVTFEEMEGGGYAIPAGNTIVFEVHADVASYSSSADIQLKFATSDSYIGAEELDDGASLSGIGTNGTCTAGTCMILVHTVDSTVWSLVSQGNLYVTSSSVPTPIRQLLGGELGESILNLKFRASDEDVDVTDIRLTSYDLSDSIDVLELYKKDETTPFALATRNCPSNALATNPITGVATKTFCADMENEQLIALEGEEVSVFVRPRMKSDVNGGASDESIQLFVNKEETVDDNSVGAILARGRESSNDLVSNNEDDVEDGEIFIGVNAPAPNQYIIGRKHTSVLSKIVSITNANPDSNGSSISSGVVPFGQFAFMAADNKNSWSGFNDVVLSDILFNVNSTNVELAYDSFRIYNKADATTKKTCTVYKSGDETPLTTNTPGALVVDCRDLTSGSGGLVNTAIDPNKKATFVLEAEVVRSSVRPEANSTLQAQIQQFNNSENTTYGHSAYDTRSHIRWQDMDSDIDGTFTWMEHPSSAVSSTSYRN